MVKAGQRVKLALLSSNYNAVQPVIDECVRNFPEADLMQVLDEGLVAEFGRAGGLNAKSAFMTAQMARSAEEMGAQAILCTCSTLSPCINWIRPFLTIPIVEIDVAVARHVMSKAHTIALASTAESVLTSVVPFFNEIGKKTGKAPDWKKRALPNAREYMKQGRAAFLKAIADHLVLCSKEAEAVIVAQVSMVGAMQYVPEEAKERIYTSVPYAVQAVKNLLGY